MASQFLTRGISLLSFSVVQLLYPLGRTLILARILSGFEFGFASALSASYSTFELVTDIAIHRFVLASARTEYEQALAAAHGLSIVRGAAAGLLACAAAPAFAYMMSVSADWTSFAWLGLAIFIRSFEHFELRVAERDYRYHGQLLVNLVANSTAVAVMIATWFYVHDHRIYIAMLFAQNISYVLASHCLAKAPYRPEFRSAYFRNAARFAFPLVLSGVGLAVVSQGDRILVGSVLDVSTLGIYSVFILTITVPAAAVTQISSSLALAGLHNAVADPERTRRRLLLYTRAMLILGVCFAFGLLAFMNIIVPFVFGPRFTAAKGIVALLAAVSFFSVSRAEPTTSILLINHRTRVLAALSLSGGLGLFAATILTMSYRSLNTVLFGRLIGEILGFGITMALLRGYLGKLAGPSFIACGWAVSWIAAAIILDMAYPLPDTALLRLVILACLATFSIGGLAFNLRSMVARAYS